MAASSAWGSGISCGGPPDWNIISRTILPLVSQSDILPGAGPVLLLATGSDELLTADQWAAGPTGVALKQQVPWTYGVLANHLWSFAGDDDRADVNATLLQPFMTYTTPTAWSFTAQTESTYDWEREQWSVPINLVAAKVTKFGNQLVSIGGGLRYWADSPESGPEGLGARAFVTLLFPR